MKAIITGAASGIGRATALRLAADSRAREGRPAQLLVADISAPGLETLIGELHSQGVEAEMFIGDLTDPLVPERLVEAAVTRFGGLDAVISNAGIIQRGSLLEVTIKDFDEAFAINTRATWLLGKAAHPWLARSHGTLIATASISAGQPTPPLGAYSASKAALVMLIRQMSVEWGPDGIRCNSISPGSTHTGMTDTRYSDPVQREAAAKRNPLHMVGSPEQQAAVIVFLASPDASYITGENIVVDGGLQNMLMLASAMGDPWKR
ncbi:SDR family NAD(P)-dependent oxidoreductase [Pseudomonas corrugata]|uniref:SDR family NAD(P)-dependent oxidoreductase n=1 Tax=Pseudomonas corrugata TaxID=47879 RepID=UPI001585E712|nr:SDR family oxidoreductase [Pseudomonas corrugata]MCI0997555.1 SDR family oxidoreductase [Pseudomonas corrugata]NUT64723.1 SDR family oxidoreductase [Pseudomonas corrugata]